MAEKATQHTHERMALTLWLGLLVAVLVTSVYIFSNLNLLAGQIMAQSAQSFSQLNPLTGEAGGTAAAKTALYVIVFLYLAVVYFLVSSWLKLGSMLLEIIIHNSREEGGTQGEPIFSMFLYLSRTNKGSDSFDPDDAEGSMPGEIIRNLAFSWVSAFLIYALSISILYLL